MHLRNVEVFCDIVACRSFSKAAESRGISQPAASHAVQQLEERLGTTLIDRSQRPLQLTTAGELYYEGCRRMLDEFRLVEDRVRRLRGTVSGRVRTAAIYSVGLLQMSEYVQRMNELYPGVDVQLDYVHPDEVYARVAGDEAELGIVSFPRDGGDVTCIPWVEQEMGLVVSPDDPLAGLESVELRELGGAAFVGFTPDLTIRRETDRLLKRNRVSVRVVHEFDNVENIKRAVEIGAGAALLPLASVRREREFGSLKAIPLADVEFTRPLGIIHKRHKHLSAAAERFVEVLHEDLGLESSDTTLAPMPTSVSA